MGLLVGALAGAVGCGGVSKSVLLRENEELRFENEQTRNALLSTHSELESRQQSLQKLQAERDRVTGQSQALEAKLDAATQQIATLESQRTDLRTKLGQAQEESERQRQVLEKVKNVASATASELAELRLRSQELEEKNAKLAGTESFLRDEHGKATTELAQAQEELTRLKAVLRSFQESTTENSLAKVEPAERVQQLERELAGARGENISLRRELGDLRELAGKAGPVEGASVAGRTVAAGGSVPVGVFSRTGSNEIYRNNPGGLVHELGGLVVERLQRAQRGEVLWDFFDIALLGLALLPVLVLLLVWVGKRRYRKLLRQAQSAQEASRRAARMEDPAAVAGAGGDGQRMPRSTSVRRVGFSPVISSKGPPGRTKAPVAPSPREVEEEWEAVLDGPADARPSAPSGAARSTGAVRKGVGAHAWEETAESEPEEDDLANTQVISRRDLEQAVGEGDALPLIGPGFRAETKKPSSEEAILDELKAAINRRFDDILKK